MNFIDIAIYITYILLIAIVAMLVFFPIFNMIKGNFGSAKGTLTGVAVLAAVLILAYLLSPADQGAFYEKMHIGPQASKIIGAGLLTTYIVGAGLIVAIIYSTVAKWFK